MPTQNTMNPMPQTDGQRVTYWKTFDQRRWGFLGWGMNRMQQALKEQASSVIDSLENNSISAAIGSLNDLQREPITRAMQDIYGKVGGQFASDVYGSFKSHSPTMQTKQVEELQFMQFMRQWIQFEGVARVQSITNTTRNRLRSFLEKAIDQGLGIEEAARLLAEQESIIGIQRARLIARTEIISASNRGSFEGARRTNLNLQKEWISTQDGRTRRIADGDKADHYTIDGQVVDMDKPFLVPNTERGQEQLMFPGDPKASAATTIMCRCTLGYRRK